MLTILQGDAIEQLRTLPDESVHCCVTSPPYWGLRDYGTAEWEGGEDGCDHQKIRSENRKEDFRKRGEERGYNPGSNFSNYGERNATANDFWFDKTCGKCGAKRIDSQLGLEKTPEQYVAKMVEVFREVRRVLRKDGTCWINLGDTYNANTGAGFNGNAKRPACARETQLPQPNGLPAKNLMGIPWRVAFALQADGWWLRSDIIWSKPNPMPESVTDRPTKAHEYLFLLTKSANYFYDAEAIKEKASVSVDDFRPANGSNSSDISGLYERSGGGQLGNPGNRNKRSVWTVATAPYPDAHFATYPPDLIKPCIMAGTSAKGCCAKCGSPWERIVTSTPPPKCERTPPRPRLDGNDSAAAGIRAKHDNWNGPELAAWKAENPDTFTWKPSCKCKRTAAFRANDGGPDFQFIPESLTPCTVLDPFAGSGTTGAVALELGRKAILIELNPKYVELIKTRCNVTPGLPLA